MKIMPINRYTFKSKQELAQKDDVKQRFIAMGSGLLLGTIGGMAYYYNKNYKGKKLWISSIEIGACIGLISDLIRMGINISKNIVK